MVETYQQVAGRDTIPYVLGAICPECGATFHIDPTRIDEQLPQECIVADCDFVLTEGDIDEET